MFFRSFPRKRESRLGPRFRGDERSNKKSEDFGSTGNIPTSVAPLLYLSGATASWHTNKRTGGGITATGMLTTAATTPSG